MKLLQRHLVRLIAVCLCSLTVHNHLIAQNETKNARGYAGDLSFTGTSLQVWDDKYTSGSWITGFTVRRNKAVVELGLEESKHFYHPAYFKIKATFDVQLTDASQNVTTLTGRQLEITYNPAEQTRYTDKAQLVFNGYYKVKVYNVSFQTCDISNNCSPGCIASDVYMQTEVNTDKIYTFTQAVTALATNQISSTYQNANSENELVVYWNYLRGASEYELEYTWVDNYDFNFSSFTSFVRPPSAVQYNISHDGTRVVTPFNSYRIPLNYERGYLVYRIRPIAKDGVGARVDGSWTLLPVSGNIQSVISTYPNFVYAISSPLGGDQFNWSGVSTFAENGRSGRGVSFADAQGLVRQNIARLNTEDKSMVQSTLYDHYARPVYSMLPAPVPGLNFTYRQNLNRINISGSPLNFDKSIYDIGSGSACGGGAFGLDPINSTGAANYYSTSNPNKEGAQGFVPSANGFPYVESRFRPDMIGRVTSVSLPGSAHNTGSGKEMRYFYTHPSQVELDRLFGSEAGPAKKYQKNFVIDPNGQTSATYLDMYGRMVGTAMMGNTPPALDAIPDNAPALTLTEDMAVSQSNIVDEVNHCVEVNTSFFVSSANEQHAFTYSTTLGKFFAAGCSQVQCYDCVYDLEFSIKDECGLDFFYDHDNNVLTQPTTLTVTIGSNAPYVSNCNGPMGSTGTALVKATGYSISATPILVTFPHAGVYNIYKKICVSDKPIEDYLSIFANEPVCSNKYCSIVDSVMNTLDYTGCGELTCSSCMQSISTFTNNKDNPRMSPDQLNTIFGTCKALCSNSPCDKVRARLCMDFVPGSGVFGALNSGGAFWNYSIFNPANQLGVGTGLGKTWNNPPFYSPSFTPKYLNNFGNPATVTISGVSYMPHQLSIAQFDNKFQMSWAEALLPLHPEYCKLKFYCEVIGASMDYEEDMKKIVHYDQACATGFLRPWPFGYGYGPSCPANFEPANSFPSMFGALMAEFSTSVTTNYNGTGHNIYENASTEVYAGSIPGTHTFGSDPCTADLEWRKFLEMYLTLKRNLYVKMMALYVQNFNPSGQGACATMPQGLESRFPNDASLYGDGIDPNWTAQNNSGQLNNAVNANVASDCISECASYVVLWDSELKNYCPTYNSALQTVKNQVLAAFEQVCRLGCNGTHPEGSSSVANPGPGYTLPSTGVVVNDFQGVLNYYLGTNNCSSYLVSAPLPYDKSDLTVTANSKITDCKCDQLLKVKYDLANNINVPLGVTTGWQLFQARYGFDMAEYNAAICVCNNALAGQTWVPGHVWTTTQKAYLTNAAFNVSPKLSCNTCVKCSDVVTQMDAQFPNIPVPGLYTNVYAAVDGNFANAAYITNYLNINNGWSYTTNDFQELYEDCKQFNTPGPLQGTFKYSVSQEGMDLFKYLQDLLQTNLLLANHTMQMCTDYKYFLSSLYTGDLPVPPSSVYQYVANVSGNNLQILINLNAVNVCVINLSLPPAYIGGWASLTDMSAISAYVATPGPGAQYGFMINAENSSFQSVAITGLSSCYVITSLSSSAPYQPAKCPAKPAKKKACEIALIKGALNTAKNVYTTFIDFAYAEFISDYKQGCLSTITETLTRTYQLDEYHYTLFYYDEAGNLQRTVAPGGVVPLPLATNIPTNVTMYPTHSSSSQVDFNYVRDSRFNTYNRTMTENTVDGGLTRYFYDKIGRVRASQNQKQLNASNPTGTPPSYIYSYTLYDNVGRITEIGEMTSAIALTDVIAGTNFSTVATPTTFVSFCAAANKRQVISTYYDRPTTITQILNKFGSGSYQFNLRNRIAFTTYSDIYNGSPILYDHATYYSYDDHGNAKAIVQHNVDVSNRFSPTGNLSAGIKKITYEYELVSGNMVKAHYEYGQRDQLSHKYVYDADNRLHEVFTSKDNVNWDREAKYFFYEHGPLARIERADKQVQGEDFYYTIHGWLKGINSQGMAVNNDVGKDGAATNAYSSNNNAIHNFFAADAMSYGLNYYHLGTLKDYEANNNGLYTTTGSLRNPLTDYTAILASEVLKWWIARRIYTMGTSAVW